MRFSKFSPITYEGCVNKEKIMPSDEILSWTTVGKLAKTFPA